jgi:hypothetical protein
MWLASSARRRLVCESAVLTWISATPSVASDVAR